MSEFEREFCNIIKLFGAFIEFIDVFFDQLTDRFGVFTDVIIQSVDQAIFAI